MNLVNVISAAEADRVSIRKKKEFVIPEKEIKNRFRLKKSVTQKKHSVFLKQIAERLRS